MAGYVRITVGDEALSERVADELGRVLAARDPERLEGVGRA
jgi:hypothetical protein